jgi:streptogramin lyase
MKLATRLVPIVVLLAGTAALPLAEAQTIVTLGSGFTQPAGVTVAANGSVFVADRGNDAVKELADPSQQGPITLVGSGFNGPGGVAVDGSGNVFIADTSNSAVEEIPVSGGAATVKTLGSGFGFGEPNAVAIDKHGNLFFIDGRAGKIYEALAAGGYASATLIGSGFNNPFALAVDAESNVFVSDSGTESVKELLAAGGYSTVVTIGRGFTDLTGVAIDSKGNLFAADRAKSTVQEFLAVSNFATVETLPVLVNSPSGIAIDAADNLFIGDDNDQGGGAATEVFAADGYTSFKIIGEGLRVTGIAVDGADNVFFSGAGGQVVFELLAAGGYVTTENLGFGHLTLPSGMAVDASGNLFVADAGQGGITELAAAGGFTTIDTLLNSGFSDPAALAIDSSGNLYVADTGNSQVERILAAGGYVTVETLGSGFLHPTGVAVDSAGNVFVADTGNNLVKEILAADNYTTTETVSPGILSPAGVAVDGSGNLLVVAPANGLLKILAVDGSIPASPVLVALGSGFLNPAGVAVDGNGDIFVADTGTNSVKELLAASPPLVAAVLPGSRAVQTGAAATVFATMINTGTAALENCQIALLPTAPAGLSLSYQTTDPVSNKPTGTPDTPVTIPGNGMSQSFVVKFQDNNAALAAPATPLAFACADAAPATIIPGIDTVDLSFSTSPVADIVVAAQTQTGNGIVELGGNGGLGAFAIASLNIGTAAPITVSADTGSAALPVQPLICPTNPVTGECLSPPGLSVPLAFPAGAVETFSVFLQATGPIVLAPASSRIFVRFKDAEGGLHASISVAVETD